MFGFPKKYITGFGSEGMDLTNSSDPNLWAKEGGRNGTLGNPIKSQTLGRAESRFAYCKLFQIIPRSTSSVVSGFLSFYTQFYFVLFALFPQQKPLAASHLHPQDTRYSVTNYSLQGFASFCARMNIF